ncbi:MAG: efflux RND transporter periplasmic adaptor subunit [Candidatus Paceibacterota bacterium]|jgi:HlyD family secretion protein
MSKRNIIIAVAVLLIIIIAFFSFSKKPEPKYTTAQVTRGEVLQTVSATGTVEAAKKLDLNFVNSGKVQEINVKVGDHVEQGAIIAKLDTAQLDSQLEQARASLNSATADLNKLIEGATDEDLKLSQTAVENARIALENAQQSLLDAEEGSQNDILSAEASVNSAKTTLANARKSLDNTTTSNENNLNQDYDNAWDTINAGLVTASNSLNTNKTTLEYEDAQDTLSVLNIQYLNNATSSKAVATNSYNTANDYAISITSSLTHDKTDEALLKTKNALENIRTALSDTYKVLSATVTSSTLTQTELDTLKSNISSARTSTNTSISNITTANQDVSTQKITNQTNLDSAQATVNSAQSSLDLYEQSLVSARSSASLRVNAAESSVKAAEGALNQAEDQLAFKKARPRSADMLSFQSQVKKAQANVDLIQNQIDNSTLKSPDKGIITEINGEIGEIATSAKVFVSIITTDSFEIKANISEVDIAKVKIEDEVKITFDALGPDKEFVGKIISIDPAQTEVSGVIYYKVTAMFTADAQIIKPGMTANLDILTAKKENVLMIPFQALKEDGSRKYVQIVENGKLTDVNIEMGLKGDINIEVLSGLFEGQSVVTFVEGQA